MPNHYFSFKEFTVWQQHCAMKVCTDACVLGAFTANRFVNSAPPPKHILDIGTGTGLLSLMLAQKINAEIEAIEINKDAAQQAQENFDTSPWASRLKTINSSLQEFAGESCYDLIIANPPFFEDDLRSNAAAKNDAKHDSSLTLHQLVEAIHKLLVTTGSAVVLIPQHRTSYFSALVSAAGMHINGVLEMRQSFTHKPFRSIVVIAKTADKFDKSILTIHDHKREYTPEFAALLKDYYLKL
ncbi:MAG: methyltransferase domain-containing protein [Chitinophagaceae bacterium]|nr:MAG: methyltransferase domain-containing protein [Chitinophagaceae bacterium]